MSAAWPSPLVPRLNPRGPACGWTLRCPPPSWTVAGPGHGRVLCRLWSSCRTDWSTRRSSATACGASAGAGSMPSSRLTLGVQLQQCTGPWPTRCSRPRCRTTNGTRSHWRSASRPASVNGQRTCMPAGRVIPWPWGSCAATSPAFACGPKGFWALSTPRAKCGLRGSSGGDGRSRSWSTSRSSSSRPCMDCRARSTPPSVWAQPRPRARVLLGGAVRLWRRPPRRCSPWN
mmetsp:Transcript_43055/g.77333  ORF Transcript_43055/g.77333 Transcript_43055/m.77333 type:complete len:231 (+) Transcript_43055:367-1059(+)